MIESLSVDEAAKLPFGFDFGIRLSVDHDKIVRFVQKLEAEFALFQIKQVHLQFEIADDRYGGIIHASIEGWIW